MILPGIRTPQKCCRADGQVVNGTREADLQTELKVHSSEVILAHRTAHRWSFASKFHSPVTVLLSVMNYISSFQVLLLEKFQMAIGSRAGTWERKQSTEWCDCSTKPEGSTPHVLLQGKVFKEGMLSSVSFCFSSSPTSVTFYLPHAAESHLSSQRESAQDNDKNDKQGEERLGVGKPFLPLPWHLHQPFLYRSPERTLKAADKNHLGEEITLLQAMWQVYPVKKKEPFKFLPWPYCLAAQYPKGSGTWNLREIRPHFWPYLYWVTDNKTNLQWVAWLNLKATVLFMHLLTKTLLTHKQIAQLHAHLHWPQINTNWQLSPASAGLPKWPCGLKSFIILLSPFFKSPKGAISHCHYT